MKEMIFSGFGGQGVLTTGLIVADIALACGMHPTWIPSYGAEMRGGKAYCVVKMDPLRVGTPVVEEADIVLAMNIPSLSMTEKMRTGGILLVNKDIVEDYRLYMTREDIQVEEVPFDTMARSIGNPKGANVVAAGLVTAILSDELDRQIGKQAMLDFFAEKGKGKFAAKNAEAFDLGYDYLQNGKGE